MHGSTIRSAGATHSCLTLRVSHRPTDGTMPSAIHIGGATARAITRAGPGAVPVAAAAVAEANQAVAVVGAAAVAAEVRTPAVGRAVVAAALTSLLQPHLLTAPNHESLTVKCRRLGGPSLQEDDGRFQRRWVVRYSGHSALFDFAGSAAFLQSTIKLECRIRSGLPACPTSSTVTT